MKFYITTPIYYANDKPHIGSTYTTVAADVLARLHRIAGDDVFFLAGVAEHGSKIAASAEKAGQEPQVFVDSVSGKFVEAWKRIDISYDDFIRTTEPRHAKAVGLFFEKLKESGKIYEGEYEGLYCVGCESFKSLDELVDGLCPLHNTKPELVKERNWFFKLSDYGDILLEKIQSNEFLISPPERRNEIIAFITRGLEDITISRQTAKFALPLPWDPEQSIYVWMDELFNYCSAIGYGSDKAKFNRYWPANLQLVGKDIIKFHCIIWPALLLAIGEEIPKQVFAHGFFTINGQKMSKTLGNVIDPIEIAEKYGADALRYFLLREVPFGEDGDVSEAKLAVRYEGDLANGLGNLVSRVSNMIEKYADGVIPEVLQPENTLANVDEFLKEYHFNEALAAIWENIAWCNKLIDDEKPWALAKTDLDAVKVLLSRLSAQILQIALKVAPFMPESAEKIRKAFESVDGIVKMEALFPRIEK